MHTALVRAQQAAHDAIMLARLTRDLPAFLRAPISLADAETQVRRHLETRATRLLGVAERHIYAHAGSPYRVLLRHAGCELGDFATLLRADGVEGTMQALATQGVYVTFDEMKGRREVVRGSLRVTFSASAFDNPTVPAHFAMYTGGSRGVPSLVGRSLPYIAEKAASRAVGYAAHGMYGAGHVFWRTGPIGQMLTSAAIGMPTRGWFYPLEPLAPRVRWGGLYLRGMGRMTGYPIPRPRYVPLEQPGRLMLFLARLLHTGERIVLSAPTSAAVRVAIAAQQAGVSLHGVTINGQSEPMSPARRAHLEAVGANVITNYGTVESSSVGYGCAAGRSADDVHFFDDGFAAVTRPRPVLADGPSIDALLLTSLSPLVQKIFFNSETGDFATLERRDCDCSMGALGLRTHLSDIRSFEKLTGEGMTVVRSDLFRILEEVLPARFGGSGLD